MVVLWLKRERNIKGLGKLMCYKGGKMEMEWKLNDLEGVCI